MYKVYIYKCRRYLKGSYSELAKSTFKVSCDENNHNDHHEGAIYIDFDYTGKYAKAYKLEKLIQIDYYDGNYFHHSEIIK